MDKSKIFSPNRGLGPPDLHKKSQDHRIPKRRRIHQNDIALNLYTNLTVRYVDFPRYHNNTILY